MTSLRNLYLSNVGQTSEMPLLLEIEKAEGVYIFGRDGKRYIDMNSGISVSSLGHCHPEVVEAVKTQSETFMHTMVYGEHVQAPQVSFARRLLAHVSDSLQSVYYLMSGTEATELAMKLAKRYTGRYEIVCCRNAYHGSTQGAESLRSDVDYRSAYLPLLPGITHIDFNNTEDLQKIDTKTACVICEVVQGEAGVIRADEQYLRDLSEKCKQVGALLVLDEIQSGFGRTGTLFAHQKYNVVPDILLIGKAMGGGMPIAGVVSSQEIMSALIRNPALGHITTFGGHPVSCAAADAALKVLVEMSLIDEVKDKAAYIVSTLTKHPIVREVRSAGMMMALETTRRKYLKHVVSKAFELGVLVDWFLFNNRSIRIAPPLVIDHAQLEEACDILLESLDYAQSKYH